MISAVKEKGMTGKLMFPVILLAKALQQLQSRNDFLTARLRKNLNPVTAENPCVFVQEKGSSELDFLTVEK